jgi:hypothetical protein
MYSEKRPILWQPESLSNLTPYCHSLQMVTWIKKQSTGIDDKIQGVNQFMTERKTNCCVAQSKCSWFQWLKDGYLWYYRNFTLQYSIIKCLCVKEINTCSWPPRRVTCLHNVDSSTTNSQRAHLDDNLWYQRSSESERKIGTEGCALEAVDIAE